MNDTGIDITNDSVAEAVRPLKKHVCFRCQRGFAKLEHLQRHERSHTKVKPYRCTLCPNAFTRKDLLTRHNNLVHASPGHVRATRASPSTSSVPDHSERALSSTVGLESSILEQRAFSVASYASGFGGSSSTFMQLAQDPLLALGTVSPAPHVQMTSAHSVSAVGDSYFNPIDNFGDYMNTISFPSNPFSPSFQPLPFLYGDYSFQAPPALTQKTTSVIIGVSDGQPNPSTTNGEASVRTAASRLPSLEPEYPEEGRYVDALNRISTTQVTASIRDHILETLQLIKYGNESFELPSTHALSRFVSGYFTWFHGHYPMFHIPTFRLEAVSPELILAITALGAQYHREPERGVELFYASQAVVTERIRAQDGKNGHHVQQEEETDADAVLLNHELHLDGTMIHHIEIVQCLVLLIAVPMWFSRRALIRNAWSLRSVLDSVLRESGLECPRISSGISWTDWIELEMIKRSKLIAVCFFNIHTVIWDLPPVVMYHDLRSTLPSTEREWKAKNENEWKALGIKTGQEPDFQETYQRLFASEDGNDHSQIQISALGGYILIQALIQDIWILQRSTRIPLQVSKEYFAAQIEGLEKALKSWSAGWEQNQESSTNPMNEYGPLSFNSTALLRLAYIRMNLGVDSIQTLSSWNPESIAQAMMNSPPLERSARATKAALQCAHALSIPIKLGLNFVAQNQVIYWSNAHAICSRECALLLSKWLEAVTIPIIAPPLDGHEKRLLSFVVDMVEETDFKAPREELLIHERRLSSIVAKLWAKLFRPDSIWELVGLIGMSLDAYGNLLERQ